MPTSKVLFHHRLFSGGGGVNDGLGFGDLIFQGFDLGDEFFCSSREGTGTLMLFITVALMLDWLINL
jgi:hypothetical protein